MVLLIYLLIQVLINMALSNEDQIGRSLFLKLVANDIVVTQLEAMGYTRDTLMEYMDIPLFKTLMKPILNKLEAVFKYYEEANLALAPTLN